MKIVAIDSTAVVAKGPGSPAYFSRYVIAHLRAAGHEVVIIPRFDAELCSAADAVWTEWCIDELREAAESGVCKKLIGRMRGFDAFGPLDKIDWSVVDHLVYESPFLQELVEERLPGLRGFRTEVIPSGIDLDAVQYLRRNDDVGPVIALVARTTADKGYQLAFEYARQRPHYRFHVTTALHEANPRLYRYLQHTRPANVTIHGTVETASWLNEIGATHILSASIWETLGYTIAEGMAAGCRPLIHDGPGLATNWPREHLWRSFEDLDKLVRQPVDSDAYRHYVEKNLSAQAGSEAFAALVLAPATREARGPQLEAAGPIVAAANNAIESGDLVEAESLVAHLRAHTQRGTGVDDYRAGLAFRLGVAHYNENNLEEARVWAARSLLDIVRPDPLCLLGEATVAQGDLENGVRWYQAACAVEDVASTYSMAELSAPRADRLKELQDELVPKLTPGPPPKRFLVVVAVRNAEKWIGKCLESIEAQTQPLHCVVIDDCSTDSTAHALAFSTGRLQSGKFTYVGRGERQWSLHNISDAIRDYGQPGDVVVIVDGDDWLAHPEALTRIAKEYECGAWVTYGNFTSLSGCPGWMPAYPQSVLRGGRLRSYPWRVSHPKTFRKELFDRIDTKDFQHDGEWFKITGDVALMLPILEMAAERSVYIPDKLYVYNDVNELNDHKLAPDEQVNVRNLICAKPPYKRLDRL